MESISTLRMLANIITQAVDTMEQVYTNAAMPLPSLDQPFEGDSPAENLRQNSEVVGPVKNIIAAAAQLTATVTDPVMMALNTALGFQVSACLGAASELNVVDILREAGPKGMHVKDIAAPSQTDPDMIARILRLLATHHLFREVSPGVYANNRISSCLAIGKSPKVLFESRDERLNGTSGVIALVEMAADVGLKAGAYLADTLQPPGQQTLPYKLAFNTEEPYFNILQRPENGYKLKRFAVAMEGSTASDLPEMILQGFDWGALSDGATVVDVGGGIGQISLAVAKNHPGLRIVNQDLGPAIQLAKAHWAKHLPKHVENKLVQHQAHDFFDPQPVKNADVFLLRHVLHNWGKARAVSILQRLREAATPNTKLVFIERIVPDSGPASGIPGADRPRAPAPLLHNWGSASAITYFFDILMHNILGATERTLVEFIDLLNLGGWKLVQVHHCPPSPSSHLVAVPSS
ncbi:O-methyltransferase [Mycena galopus ATCC 62051]|nr:O-methyltransferase [Mycena galopus ATCC 62051]